MRRIVNRLFPAALVVGLDQGIKALVRARFAHAGRVTLIPGALAIRYAENRGAAFSFLQQRPGIIMALTALLLILVGAWLFGRREKSRVTALGLSLVLGGGIGNLIDRALFGFVTDYVEVLFVRFAIFNLADCAICVGALLCAARALKKEGP